MISLLRDNLPPQLTYHSVEHTQDVMQAARWLANKENLDSYSILMLETAALLHDSGFLRTYRQHEEKSCEISKELLPEFGYSPDDITIVCALIMATRIPQTPLDHLAMVLCDADLDYLGRDDFYKIGNTLFRELEAYGLLEGEKAWNRLQLKFLETHNYFTESSRSLRDPVKQGYLVEIKKLVESY